MKKLAILVALAIITVAALRCSPGYVVRAGIEEAKILSQRQPLEAVRRDPATPAEMRRKLDLVAQARDFARQALGLDVGESYTTFSRVDRDTLLMVLSASPADRMRPVTWWFPIVGRIPYKGFFDPADAEAAAAQLEAKGYDIYIRPSGAFSTLGWFNDPLLSTALDQDEVGVVATVIHEVTHNTLFLPSQVAFNESFANFVGDYGAVEFFCALEGEDGERCRRARAIWSDNLVFGRFLGELIGALESVYAREDLGSDEKVAARDDVIAAARERFQREVRPQLQLVFRGFHEARINNATLIAIRLYYDRLDLFDAVLERTGGDLRRAIERIAEAAEARPDEPYEALASVAARR